MRFGSKGISSRKATTLFCDASPQMIFHTPTCHATLKSGSQHGDTPLLKHNGTIKNQTPKGNNRTSVWINANVRLDGRYEREQRQKGLSSQSLHFPNPPSNHVLPNLSKDSDSMLYFSANFQHSNMRKPQGERSNSRAGWGKVQLPKGHSCAETSQSC